MFWKKKNPKITFKCSQCGQIHNTWPALGYGEPWHYSQLTPQQQKDIAKIDEDFCEIHWEEQTDRFIRTTLTIPVNNFELNLEYGLWVSLSEKSYNDYSDQYERTDYESGYFGWVCNQLLGYEDTLSVPTDVNTQLGTRRPILDLHKDYDHQLVSRPLKSSLV
ncbi:MAG: DUF2199 domain-containing protein [Verrucomicrobiota bacterium]